MRPHHGEVEHLDQMRGLAQGGEGLKEGFEYARLAEAPKALPH